MGKNCLKWKVNKKNGGTDLKYRGINGFVSTFLYCL